MKYFILPVLFFSIAAVQTVSAQKPEPSKDSSVAPIKFYGFITLDATYDFQNMGKNDVFKPGDIPVHPQYAEPAFFMSAKQTRFGAILTKQTPIGTIKGQLEMDFHNAADQPNGLMRIRHAFVQLKGLTVGQTWSTFYDIESRPQTVDYQGPAGSTFTRVPLIRYDLASKNHTWSLGLEDPAEEITTKGNVQVRKQTVPEIVAAYKIYWNNKKSFLKIGLLGRQLKYQTTDSVQSTIESSNLYGWGAMTVGKLNLRSGKGIDNIKFELVTGSGIAHYMLGTTGLGLDAAVNTKTETQKPEDINLSGGFISYQHYWSAKFNSTAIAGAYRIADKALLSGNSTHSSVYTTANLFYTPVTPLAFGLEYQYGDRKTINDQHGNASRIQGTMIYNF
ncbi:MAG TPA: DcaP family trimeric outer membrane transporter [Chitinophagaceae bacterium]|nr:DcaP family trimeric outer membrane transporter [Chitinophagaceae bacterium]